MTRTRNADSFPTAWSALVSAAIFGILMFSVAPATQAATLEIQFTGLDLFYDGTNIFDNGVHNTARTGNPTDADSLSSIQFFLDDTLVHTINSNVFADVYIANVGAIPVGGALLTSGGNGNDFGIDLLTSNNNPGWGLALDINTLRVFYTGSRIAIAASGLASGIPVQNLPPGLVFDPSEPLTIIMSSANLTGVTTGGGFITSMHAAGTGNVAGILVPEPGSIVLLAVGLLGATLLGWRHRNRR